MHSGGCFCGALRYACDADPVEQGYCHCSICRRTTGGTLVAFASFPVAHFRYLQGHPAVFQSSARGQREFCSRCGTQIAFRGSHAPATVDVNIGSLDDPTRVPPQFHIFDQDRLSWLQISDSLPRHPQGLKRN